MNEFNLAENNLKKTGYVFSRANFKSSGFTLVFTENINI